MQAIYYLTKSFSYRRYLVQSINVNKPYKSNDLSLFFSSITIRSLTEPTSPNMWSVRVHNACLPFMVGRQPTITASSCCSYSTYWSSFGCSTLAWPWSNAPWLGHLQVTTGPRRSRRISHHAHSFHHSAGL